MSSLYVPESSIYERIYYLKFYETYDPSQPINIKLNAALNDIKNGNFKQEEYSEYMEKIIDAIIYTRNIHSGRGLRDLTYSYLFTLQQLLPMKTIFLLYIMVNKNSNAEDQIGSWRDVRSYCEFVAKHSINGRNDVFIKPIIGLYNNQLMKDNEIWNNIKDNSPKPEARDHISYAAKWVPRESKGRNWMFDILVSMWTFSNEEYKNIMNSAKTSEQKSSAERKCKMMYRKMVSNLNKELDTLEIKQCSNNWSEIEPEKVSMTQLYNGSQAFLQVSTEDRAKCASTFDAFYKEKMEEIAKKKYSYNVPVWKLVKHMIRLVKEDNKDEIDAMNLHWKAYVDHKWRGEKDYYIAILDVSESMYENGAKDLYTAIGMGCAIASKSLFGKNVMVLTHKPEWVDLTHCSFSTMIHRIMTTIWNSQSSVFEAFQLVLDAVIASDMTPDEVENFKIQLFTNKQIDYDCIFQMWKDAGIEKFGQPFILDGQNFEKMSL